MKKERQIIEIMSVFDQSKTPVSFDLKMRAANLVLGLMSHRKNFGLFVILGWQKKWQKYLDFSDVYQDIFIRNRMNIMKIRPNRRPKYNVADTVKFDGAILINKTGDIIHSGVIIEGLRPRMIAQKLNPGQFRDLSEQFGFKAKVHTRHLAAIASSYVFRGTTVFTVSEENNALHIFENGRIIYSTL